MPRPTSADLALLRSNMPVRRIAAPITNTTAPPQFANLLQTASVGQSRPLAASRSISLNPTTPPGSGPATMSRSQILDSAKQFMGVPYVWGGTSASGLDCSAFLSRAWGVSRQTTDTLASVSRPVGKEDLKAGDALNLTTARDADGAGHVRLFDSWANPEHTKMWVYEETPPRAVHHIINWDPSYQPMRRVNVTDA